MFCNNKIITQLVKTFWVLVVCLFVCFKTFKQQLVIQSLVKILSLMRITHRGDKRVNELTVHHQIFPRLGPLKCVILGTNNLLLCLAAGRKARIGIDCKGTFQFPKYQNLTNIYIYNHKIQVVVHVFISFARLISSLVLLFFYFNSVFLGPVWCLVCICVQ